MGQCMRFGTFCTGQQPRLRKACDSEQSHQGLQPTYKGYDRQ